MDEGVSVYGSVSVKREREATKHSFDDFLYLVMGESTIGNAIILLLTIIFFGTAPVLLILLFANYSGGMRWLLTLGIVTSLGVMAVYLMKRGTRKKRTFERKSKIKTEFPGALTEITDAVQRGSIGYVYSQHIMRERLCDDIINKLALVRDLSEDEVISKLEAGETKFVNDEILAKFLLKNRRGTGSWDEVQLAGKGKSAERGQRFLNEIEVILDRMEEIV